MAPMLPSLEYARPEREGRSLALPAFVCGLCSGPAAVGLAVVCVASHLDEQTKELLALLSLVVVLGGALVFGCVARSRLPLEARFRLWVFADLAVIAPIGWTIAILAFIGYALSQL